VANGTNGKLSAEDFTLKAIEMFRDTTKSMGIHSVYSGFNGAFRKYYGEGADPVAATTALAKAGKVTVQMRRGGAMLYIPGEAPKEDKKAAIEAAGTKALASMGLK
jgi:hypothetical protein